MEDPDDTEKPTLPEAVEMHDDGLDIEEGDELDDPSDSHGDAVPMAGRRLRSFGTTAFGSVKSFAESLGMQPSNLQKYLSGKREPGAIVLARIAELGCNIHWLISGEGEMFANNDAGRTLRLAIEDRLGRVFEPEALPGYPVVVVDQHPIFRDVDRIKQELRDAPPDQREKLLEELSRLLEKKADLLERENLLQRGQITAFEKILAVLRPR